MPTEMPQGKMPGQDAAAPALSWVSRTLNWTALLVGFGLCFWALNYGATAPEPNSPSLSAAYALHE